MKKVSLSKMENTQGGKFWGKGETNCTKASDLGNGNCWYNCSTPHYAFWLKVDVTYEGTGVRPC